MPTYHRYLSYAPRRFRFGSIVVDDPAAMTKTIFDAVERTGVRALVSAGWSDIGGDNVPDDVFILGEFSCQACEPSQ